MKNDISATEAAAILEISVATLYSYVSRGLLSAKLTPASRTKRYVLEEVMHLAARRRDAKHGGHSATAAINWGLPILETRLSHIDDGRLFYRGYEITGLAASATLESVACLLWDDSKCDYFAARPASLDNLGQVFLKQAQALTHELPPLKRAMALLPILASASPSSSDVEGAFFSEGAHLMRQLAAVLLETDPSDASGLALHLQVAKAWRIDAVQAELLRSILVLLAEHELNASTFTVRCVASTGADLSATLCAGLASLSGAEHGGGCAASKLLLIGALAAPVLSEFIENYFAQLDPELCGFGHPFYPKGDPRAGYLLDRLSELGRHNTRLASINSVCKSVAAHLKTPPNVDLAIAALELGYDWPDSAGIILFALARSAGWIAHANEQRAAGTMIRPRARYVGKYRAD